MINSRGKKRDGYQPLAGAPANLGSVASPSAATAPQQQEGVLHQSPVQPEAQNGPQITLTRPDGSERSSSLPTLGRRVSPSGERQSLDQRRGGKPLTVATAARNVVASGQALPPVRQRDKFVPLPDATESPAARDRPPFRGATIFEDLQAPTVGLLVAEAEPAARGRITVYCIAESLDRKLLEQELHRTYPGTTLHSYPEVLYLPVPGEGDEKGDLFFFDFGVVCCWGLTQVQEQVIISQVTAKCQQEPLPAPEVEVDEFQFIYSASEHPNIQNDTITMNKRHAQNHQVKLAISHALAQSTKLSVYEQRIIETVFETKHLPEQMARHGKVNVSIRYVAQLIGKVFLQKSAVNLLSTILDTPEVYWSFPDFLQALYARSCEYLELETRVEVLNARFQVLQEMMEVLRDHQNNSHNARLEWIIIWLIAVELVVGLFQLLGLSGMFFSQKQP